MPGGEAARRVFDIQSAEIQAAGGFSQIVAFDAESEAQRASLAALFDRTAEYSEMIGSLESFKRDLAKLKELDARQRMAGLSRDVASIVGRDFFPGPTLKQVESGLADAEAAVNRRFAPDEPHGRRQKIRVRDRKTYSRRAWATRERLWIDRVASAWLIRRFIDPKAKFVWLKRVKDCPRGAVGFDFDGAEFTHVDSKVTFEVLIASFALDSDPALRKLAGLVHQLDVGGLPVAEAPGFATIMAGARTLQEDDSGLLQMMSLVLDGLYAGYGEAKTK
jgi:hypothetical protein